MCLTAFIDAAASSCFAAPVLRRDRSPAASTERGRRYLSEQLLRGGTRPVRHHRVGSGRGCRVVVEASGSHHRHLINMLLSSADATCPPPHHGIPLHSLIAVVVVVNSAIISSDWK